MDRQRWQKIESLLESSLRLPRENRNAFLSQACDGDAALQRETESLIRHLEQAGSFLEAPPSALAHEMLSQDQKRFVAGDVVGGYEIVSRLGGGGMADVYLASDPRLHRMIALKVLSPALAGERGYRKRFEDEARLASRLNHPNIVTIFGVGDDDGTAFIAMELIDGRTLREVLSEGALPIRRALDIAIQIADALAAAHAAGIVHRDLKPENVMMTATGQMKVLDFGLARTDGIVAGGMSPSVSLTLVSMTQAGMILGAVGYMSPEQASGRVASFAADQFSFGAILYEMLTGRRAFARDTAIETLSAIIRDEPPTFTPPEPGDERSLAQVLTRCLAKNPADRFESTQQLIEALRTIRTHEGQWKENETLAVVSEPPRPRLDRRRAIQLAAAVGVSTLAGFGAWHMRRSHERTPSYKPSPEVSRIYERALKDSHNEDEESYLYARKLLTDIVAMDPQFAAAYLALAHNYIVMAVDGYESPEDNARQVRTLIRNAAALQQNMLEIHYALAAEALFLNWDWKTARREYNLAAEIPGVSDSDSAVDGLWAMGQTDAALKWIKNALIANANNTGWRLREADLLAYSGQLAEAASLYEEIIKEEAADPRAYFGLAEVRHGQLRDDDAIAAMQRGCERKAERNNEAVAPMLAVTLQRARGAEGYRTIEKQLAEFELDRLDARYAGGDYTSPLDYAREFSLLEQKDKAITKLRAALAERSPGLVFLKVDRAWNYLRDEAQFQEAVRKVGVP